jgi:hypothetical protein
MGLEDILKACTRNRAMCCAAGILKPLIEAARLIFTGQGWVGGVNHGKWASGPLLSCIELLGGHSLSVGDLRDLLRGVQDATKLGEGASLLGALEKALDGEEGRGPAYTFEFDGEFSMFEMGFVEVAKEQGERRAATKIY